MSTKFLDLINNYITEEDKAPDEEEEEVPAAPETTDAPPAEDVPEVPAEETDKDVPAEEPEAAAEEEEPAEETDTDNNKEDMDKIKKVISDLKKQNASKTNRLAKEFENIIQKQNEINKELGKVKDKSKEVYDALLETSNEIWSLVIRTTDVTASLLRDNVQKKITFNAEMFVDKILEIIPELKSQINIFAKECNSSKLTNKKLSDKEETKEESTEIQTEGFHNFFKDAMKYVDKIKTSVMKWTKGYNKKIQSIQTQLDKFIVKGTEEAQKEDNESLSKEESFIISKSNRYI